MVDIKQKIEASLMISSYLETVGFKNGVWEFNFNEEINSINMYINTYTYLFNDEFFAPDEHYFNNLCKKFKIKFLKRKITYNDWKNSKGRPKTYYDLINEKVYNIQKKNPNAFFMRKIDKTCILPSYFNTFVD
jgi:hypothetical protein